MPVKARPLVPRVDPTAVRAQLVLPAPVAPDEGVLGDETLASRGRCTGGRSVIIASHRAVVIAGDEEPVADLPRAVEPFERDPAEMQGACPLQPVEDRFVTAVHEWAEVLLVDHRQPGAVKGSSVVLVRRIAGAAPMEPQEGCLGRALAVEVARRLWLSRTSDG